MTWPRREAQKEVELLEKKMQRLEAARAAEIAQLTTELEGARTSMVEQLSAKDSKVNDLVEELGNTQALLSEKEAALAEVCTTHTVPTHWLLATSLLGTSLEEDGS